MKNFIPLLSLILFFKAFCPLGYSSIADAEPDVSAKSVVTQTPPHLCGKPLIDEYPLLPTKGADLPPRKANFWTGKRGIIKQVIIFAPFSIEIALQVVPIFMNLSPAHMALSTVGGQLGGGLMTGIYHASHYYAPANTSTVMALLNTSRYCMNVYIRNKYPNNLTRCLLDYGTGLSGAYLKYHYVNNSKNYFHAPNGYLKPLVTILYSTGKFIYSLWLKLRRN